MEPGKEDDANQDGKSAVDEITEQPTEVDAGELIEDPEVKEALRKIKEQESDPQN